MKVRMFPNPAEVENGESGIHTVCRAYAQHMPAFGVEFVDDFQKADVIAVHAGVAPPMPKDAPITSILHGVYWSEDHNSPAWEFKANQSVIDSIRYAREVTVPSAWVNETLQRDMRFSGTVVPHGVDWQGWQHSYAHEGYVLGYAKNRADSDVCDPAFLTPLAQALPDVNFIATFARPDAPQNVYKTGVVPYSEMKELTQKAEVFISPIKETFGLHALEALAAGVPVLSPNFGGVIQFVQHGVNGYLYDPHDIDDMVKGLAFCRKYRSQLSANAREISRHWTWEAACAKMVAVLERAAKRQPPTVGWVIPFYNKSEEQLRRAIDSALAQTFPVERVVVVDDGSADDTALQVVKSYGNEGRIYHRRTENQGVAQARNTGASLLGTKYIGFLDADDWLQPDFTLRCVKAMEGDNSLHLAYTKLRWTDASGKQGLSDWPGDWNFDRQISPRSQRNMRGHNQIPTTNLMRRETFVRLGGYRSRYEGKGGAGAEDADLWTRWGAYGYKAALVTAEPLFEYSAGTGATSQAGWQEATWLDLYPWVKDLRHPFASYATPKRFSHPVRQYDEPIISVVIPVGPKHMRHLVNALDNLDAQTYRKWEAIVVDDTGGDDEGMTEYITTTIPYIRWVTTPGKQGAGYARNRGAEIARGQFLVFLDADDNLIPEALSRFMHVWGDEEAAVYSDYVGLVHPGDADQLAAEVTADPHREVLSWDGETMVIRHNAALYYDWERAQRQPVPGEKPYLPCLVTTLMPRAWHIAIGGFDEKMKSWEDVDYYWRIARAGYCMTRVAEPLVVYRFSTGTRRDAGLQDFSSLLEYLIKKYKKEKPPVACNCGSKAVVPPNSFSASPASNGGGNGNGVAMPVNLRTKTGNTIQVMDNDLIRAKYMKPGSEAGRTIGAVSGIDYGYRTGGEEFLVHKQDVFDQRGNLIAPAQFTPVLVQSQGPKVERAHPPPPPVLRLGTVPNGNVMANFATDELPAPKSVKMPDPLVSEVPGIGEGTTRKLRDMGIATVNELILAGEGVLKEAGLPPAKAQAAFVAAIGTLAPQPA